MMMDKFYPTVVVAVPAADGGGYMGFAPDLKGCMSHGDTPKEALANTQDAVGEWIEEAKASNLPIPEPGSAAVQARKERANLLKRIKEQNEAIEGLSADVRKLNDLLEDVKSTVTEFLTERLDDCTPWMDYVPAALASRRGKSNEDAIH